jgi:hypothetical protein
LNNTLLVKAKKTAMFFWRSFLILGRQKELWYGGVSNFLAICVRTLRIKIRLRPQARR